MMKARSPGPGLLSVLLLAGPGDGEVVVGLGAEWLDGDLVAESFEGLGVAPRAAAAGSCDTKLRNPAGAPQQEETICASPDSQPVPNRPARNRQYIDR